MLGRLFSRRRWIVWLVALPLLAGGTWGAVALLNRQTKQAAGVAERDTLAAALDATDPGWRAVDLCAARNAALPPSERNAAELAHAAFRKLSPEYLAWQSDPGDPVPPPAELPTPERLAELRTKLAGVKAAVDVARAIRTVPGGGFSLTDQELLVIDNSVRKAEELREVATLLKVDAAVRAYEGDADTALDSALAILAVARGIGDEPTPSSQVQRAAVAAIAVSSIERILAVSPAASDAKLAEVQAALAAEAEAPRMRYALRGERATLFRLLENLDAGPVTTGRKFMAPPAEELAATQAYVLDVYTQLLCAAELPYGPKRDADTLDIRRKNILDRAKPAGRFVDDFYPRFESAARADIRTAAKLRAGTAAVACERQRLKTGEFPQTLADPPTDPFTGKPMLLATFDDGIAVYSVGLDRTDHLGINLDATRLDLGVRLFHPQHRRQPPAEKP